MPYLNDVKKWEKQYFIIQNWKDESENAAIEWHRNVNKIPPDRINDFKAGYEQGYREAICTLKMQDMIKY